MVSGKIEKSEFGVGNPADDSCFSFAEIRTFAPFDDIIDLYPTFHGADVSGFLRQMETWRREKHPEMDG